MAKAKTETTEETEPKDRRTRGLLEADIKRVTDKLVAGKLELPEGTNATPHRLANLLKEEDGLDAAPSTGAVANILTRWRDWGFALVNEKPLYFKGYSAKGKEQGLDALRAKAQEAKKAARKAERAANDGKGNKPVPSAKKRAAAKKDAAA